MGGISFDVLKDKNALIIFVSQLVSTICDKMMSLGLVWFLTKTYSINVVPWYMAICFFPHLLMAFYSTNFINRVGVLKTVIASEFFRAFVLLFLYASFFLFHLEDQTLLTALFVAGFLVGLGSSVFNPAILSLPPKLVNAEKVIGLNALIDMSLSISTILGATFAIFLLNIVDLKTLVLINALSFLWAGVLQLGLKTNVNSEEVASIDESEIVQGTMSVLKKYPHIARILGSFLFLNLVTAPLLVMIPWYVQNLYAGDSSSLALIEGAMGLGAFLTGIYMSLANFQINGDKRISMIAIVSLMFGISILFFAFSLFTWQGAFVLFSIGALITFLNIQILTYFQTALNEREVPAIMTAVNIISAASVPISLSFSGLIFPYVYIPSFAKVSGLLVVLIALIMPKFLKGSVWKTEMN